MHPAIAAVYKRSAAPLRFMARKAVHTEAGVFVAANPVTKVGDSEWHFAMALRTNSVYDQGGFTAVNVLNSLRGKINQDARRDVGSNKWFRSGFHRLTLKVQAPPDSTCLRRTAGQGLHVGKNEKRARAVLRLRQSQYSTF